MSEPRVGAVAQKDKSQPIYRDNCRVVITLSFIRIRSPCATLDPVSDFTQCSPFEGGDGGSGKVSNLPRVTHHQLVIEDI